MKTFRSIAAAFIFAAILAVSGFAQTANPAAAGKVAVINTQAFDTDKGGIAKYVGAMNTLEGELKGDITALQTISTKLQSLQTELEDLQKRAAETNPKVPVDPVKLRATAQTKYEEFQTLQTEFKRKQEDYKAKAERRELAIMGPIRQDIGNALQEFAKKNGYMMILDAAKLDSAGLLLAFDDKYDATKDFIAFYNTRPTTTAVK